VRLSLFTVFHANLAFSSVPAGDLGRVVDRCLWPLVETVRLPGVRLGLEMPADTLAWIGTHDVLLLDALRAAIGEGTLELVGSGLTQSILPLVPAAVGAHNLRRGQDVYREWLGRAPRLAYLHEQTYAAGLVPLYREAGYEALVAEWENPASAHGWPEERRYRAAWVEGTGGSRIACLWNSSVVFQRVQRYAHGEIEQEELLALLAAHHHPGEARALCLYGNDCEVFDYRPGAPALRYGAGAGGEWERLRDLLAALAADPRFALVTPSEALARHPPAEPALRLESAAAPVPAKKQARYNVTRWAVCGRDNVRLNARCHALARRLEVVAALERVGRGAVPVGEGTLVRHADELARLWGSDFRTHTTDERAADAAARTGALGAALDRLVARLEPHVLPLSLASGEVALFNPHPTPWAGWPVAVHVRFPPGLVRGGLRVEADGREVAAQAEEVEIYRDGSWRSALVVVAPVVPALGVVRLACGTGPAPAPAGAGAPARIDTASASVVLSARRGATLRTLAFPRLAAAPLAGTVAQGAFTPIELAADWYSGHVVLHDAVGTKHTDLEATALVPLAAPEACPIRIPVAARLAGAFGELWKTVYVYRDVARVDVRYDFAFRDQRPRSLRVGALTLDPAAFAPGRLRYATVNGGRDVEIFPLGATRVQQHEPVSLAVSARGCLGATEGWVDLGDAEKGVVVAFDAATLAAAPMVQHEPAGDRALTRLFLSLAESDETAAPFFRGRTTFTVAYLGRGADLAAARRQAVGAARGLHVLRPVGEAHGG
jgi:hypothetical protein